MPDPTAPAPTPAPGAAPAAPAAAPAPSSAGADDIAARLRAHAGLPPAPAKGAPDPKGGAPSQAAPPAGTPTAPTTAALGATSQPDKPLTEEKPGEPKKSEGQLALELVREQRARAELAAQVEKLQAQLKAGEPDGAAAKSAKDMWAAGKFADAIRTAFGVKNFSDDFLVQLAQADGPGEPPTIEQIREQVRAELKADEDARAAELAGLRAAAVEEVGKALVASPDRWPTVWKFGVSGEQIAAKMDASFDPRTGRTASPEQIFDELEKEYRADVEGLPYWQRAADPGAPATPAPPAAPRSFGTESRRGPVPTTEPPKPMTAEERWAARRKADAEWRAKTFAPSRN